MLFLMVLLLCNLNQKRNQIKRGPDRKKRRKNIRKTKKNTRVKLKK